MGIQKDEKMKKKSNLKIIPDDKFFKSKEIKDQIKKIKSFIKEANGNLQSK